MTSLDLKFDISDLKWWSMPNNSCFSDRLRMGVLDFHMKMNGILFSCMASLHCAKLHSTYACQTDAKCTVVFDPPFIMLK